MENLPTFKMILVGDAGNKNSSLNTLGVGKSSLLVRFTREEYTNDYHVTLGVEFLSKIVQLISIYTGLKRKVYLQGNKVL